MRILTVIGILIFAISAQALDCQLLMIADGPVLEEDFTVDFVSQGHNPNQQVFESGDYMVTTTSDGKWMGIEWQKDEKIIASGLSVIQDSYSKSRVLMLFNPENPDHQVSLNCSQKE